MKNIILKSVFAACVGLTLLVALVGLADLLAGGVL